MKFLGMGGFEFVIILIVILLIFGPKNLPKLGNAFGKTVSNLRAGMNEGKKKEVDEAAEGEEPQAAEVVGELAAEVEEVADGAQEAAEVAAAQVEEAAAEAEAQAEEATGDVAEAAEGAVAEAVAAVDEAFDEVAGEAPKKVKRVVRKKVVADQPAEPVE